MRKNISIPDEVWRKAIFDSEAFFGRENVSGYITYLIKHNGSKKEPENKS